MKLTVSKKWFIQSAAREGDSSVEAGSPDFLEKFLEKSPERCVDCQHAQKHGHLLFYYQCLVWRKLVLRSNTCQHFQPKGEKLPTLAELNVLYHTK